MRDMLLKKFQNTCRYLGFDPIARGAVFVSDDGQLHVPAVVEDGGVGTRINRRASLEKLVTARKAHTAAQAARKSPADQGAALHSQAATSDFNETAPGASTPRAGNDPSRLGE